MNPSLSAINPAPALPPGGAAAAAGPTTREPPGGFAVELQRSLSRESPPPSAAPRPPAESGGPSAAATPGGPGAAHGERLASRRAGPAAPPAEGRTTSTATVDAPGEPPVDIGEPARLRRMERARSLAPPPGRQAAAPTDVPGDADRLVDREPKASRRPGKSTGGDELAGPDGAASGVALQPATEPAAPGGLRPADAARAAAPEALAPGAKRDRQGGDPTLRAAAPGAADPLANLASPAGLSAAATSRAPMESGRLAGARAADPGKGFPDVRESRSERPGDDLLPRAGDSDPAQGRRIAGTLAAALRAPLRGEAAGADTDARSGAGALRRDAATGAAEAAATIAAAHETARIRSDNRFDSPLPPWQPLADTNPLLAAVLPAAAAGPAAGRVGDGGSAAEVWVRLPTPVASPEFVPRLGGELALLARDGVQEARIQVNPVELGPIAVQITLDGNAAQVNLAVDSALTRQILDSAMPTLAAALHEQGLTLTGGGVFQQPRQSQPPPREGGQAPTAAAGHADASDADPAGATTRPAARRTGLVDLYA